MQNDFRFDAGNHHYFLGERRLPSVTEIINSILPLPSFATEWHLDKGSKLHKAIALYLRGKLDETSVDEKIRGQLEAAKKAIKELGIKPALIEVPLYHKVLQFAGTPDLLADKGILIDFKSSHAKEVIVQAGGYVCLLENNGYPVKKCYEIILEDDRYVVNEYKPSRSKNLFLATLSIYQWRQNGK